MAASRLDLEAGGVTSFLRHFVEVNSRNLGGSHVCWGSYDGFNFPGWRGGYDAQPTKYSTSWMAHLTYTPTHDRRYIENNCTIQKNGIHGSVTVSTIQWDDNMTVQILGKSYSLVVWDMRLELEMANFYSTWNPSPMYLPQPTSGGTAQMAAQSHAAPMRMAERRA